MSRYFFSGDFGASKWIQLIKFFDLKARKPIKTPKISTCKKIKQEEQEKGSFNCGDFGASRSIFLTVVELLMV